MRYVTYCVAVLYGKRFVCHYTGGNEEEANRTFARVKSLIQHQSKNPNNKYVSPQVVLYVQEMVWNRHVEAETAQQKRESLETVKERSHAK